MPKKELSTTIAHKKGLVATYQKALTEILPKQVDGGRMIRVFQGAITRNPKLLECSDVSILTALATCGAFGLEPNTPMGQCHIIPYKQDATFQMGYQGLIELARRAGTTIRCGMVREGDVFEMDCGLNPNLIHRPKITGALGDVIGYYAIAHTKSGIPLFEYMSSEQVEAHGRRYSKAYSKPDSPWKTAFDSMGMKTVIIKVCKYAPKSILAEYASVEVKDVTGRSDETPSISALIDDDNVDMPVFDVDVHETSKETLDDIAGDPGMTDEEVPFD